LETKKLKYYKCTYCKYKTTRKFCLESHIDKKHNYENIKNNNNSHNLIELQNQLINKLLEQVSSITTNNNSNNTNNQITKNNSNTNNSNNKIINTNNSNNKIITKNQNVYNYIVNNVRPSTNIQIELNKPLTVKEITMIKTESALDSSYKFITQRFIKNRKCSERLIVCCDMARRKFGCFGENDEWYLDPKLKTFFEIIFNKISDVYTNKIEYNPDDSNKEEFIQNVKSNTDGYFNYKDCLKDNPISLSDRISKDTLVNKEFILKHKAESEVNKKD
jgi:hypothetical protein